MKQQIIISLVCTIIVFFFMGISIYFLVVPDSKKFTLTNELTNCFFIIGFCTLVELKLLMSSLFSKQKTIFTLIYLVYLSLTSFFALKMHHKILAASFMVLHIITLAYLILGSIPWDALKVFGPMSEMI